jgi:hypothetical protein
VVLRHEHTAEDYAHDIRLLMHADPGRKAPRSISFPDSFNPENFA